MTGPAPRPLVLGVYRLLLRAYPRRFRSRHGEAMVDVFLAKHEAVTRGAGLARRAGFWMETLVDVARNAGAERAASRRPVVDAPRRRPSPLAALALDVGFAVRRLAREPGFSLVAIVTLALGIGANTAVFSSVNGVLLRPLGFERPDQLVQVWQSDLSRGVLRNPVPPGLVLDWQARARGFEDLAACLYTTANLTGGRDPERIPVAYVSAGFFTTLGVLPVVGRGFVAGDTRAGAARVAIVSHAFWQRRMAGGENALGSAIHFSGEPYTVIGIMPDGFEHLSWRGADVWLPLALDEADRSSGGLRVVGRLRDGVALSAARADLAALQAELAGAATDRDNIQPDVFLVPLQEDIVRGTTEALVLVQVAALFVLLIMCANLASVLLARGSAREKELAIRAAMGAGRRRLARQLLTESAVLAVAGGVPGLLVAWLGVRALVAALPPDMPRLDAIGIDWHVLAAALGLSVVTGLLFGVVPALRAARGDLEETLRAGGRGAVAARPRALGVFVVTEVALALVLLAGAGLMTRTFAALSRVDPGFDMRGALAVEVSLPLSRYEAREAQARFFAELEDRLTAVAGVGAVAEVNTLPLSQSWGSVPLDVGRGEPARALFYQVSPAYFDTMGIALRGGRGFTDRDGPGSAPVAVVSEALARRLWPDAGAVGQRVRLPWEDDRREVVGVVSDVRHTAIADPPEAGVYVPAAQAPFSRGVLVVRADLPADALAARIRDVVRDLDPNVPLFNVRTLEQLQAEAVSPARLVAGMTGAFSLLALALGAVGLYGVIAYATTRRTREMGIRMALGARRADVIRLFIGQGLTLLVIGLALGLVAALALAPLMASLLFGVEPTDPPTLAAVTLLLLLVGVTASYLPARRATKIDPMVALRVE